MAEVDAACAGGADRIELCVGLDRDGLTPPCELIAAARDRCRVGLHILLRCRPGNFAYAAAEVEAMAASLDAARALGIDGVALGCLTSDGHIDLAGGGRLVAAAGPLSVTFHRAFDRVRGDGVPDLRRLGVDRVLTSGGATTAEAGTQRLRELVSREVRIIAAGSIRAHNAAAIVAATGVREIHAAVGRLTAERAPERLAQAVRELKLAANGLRSAPAGRR